MAVRASCIELLLPMPQCDYCIQHASQSLAEDKRLFPLCGRLQCLVAVTRMQWVMVYWVWSCEAVQTLPLCLQQLDSALLALHLEPLARGISLAIAAISFRHRSKILILRAALTNNMPSVRRSLFNKRLALAPRYRAAASRVHEPSIRSASHENRQRPAHRMSVTS